MIDFQMGLLTYAIDTYQTSDMKNKRGIERECVRERTRERERERERDREKERKRERDK